MTATNHALTGAIIGLVIHQPLVALPLAFASHFVLDSLPHYTPSGSEANIIGSKRFRYTLGLEATACLFLVLLLVWFQPSHWLMGAVCAFTAASPDFMWVGRFLRAQQGKELSPPRHPIGRFHARIQWFAKPEGALVEALWAFAAIFVLAKII